MVNNPSSEMPSTISCCGMFMTVLPSPHCASVLSVLPSNSPDSENTSKNSDGLFASTLDRLMVSSAFSKASKSSSLIGPKLSSVVSTGRSGLPPSIISIPELKRIGVSRVQLSIASNELIVNDAVQFSLLSITMLVSLIVVVISGATLSPMPNVACIAKALPQLST